MTPVRNLDKQGNLSFLEAAVPDTLMPPIPSTLGVDSNRKAIKITGNISHTDAITWVDHLSCSEAVSGLDLEISHRKSKTFSKNSQ